MRRWRNLAQIEQVVADFETSGLRRTDFCRQQGISLSTLNRYLSRRRASTAIAGVNLMAVELSRGRPAERTGADSGLAVALAAGRRKIEVTRGFDAETLVQLVGLLERF